VKDEDIEEFQRQLTELRKTTKALAEEAMKLARWNINNYVTVLSHLNVIYTVLEREGLITKEAVEKMHAAEVNRCSEAVEREWRDGYDK
jgi:hypothetical protein